jgi:hypothetical protein
MPDVVAPVNRVIVLKTGNGSEWEPIKFSPPPVDDGPRG